MDILVDTHFWLGLGKITLINIVLSIDNAIVIALVARTLPAHRQMQAVTYGTVAVVIVRIALTLLAAALLTMRRPRVSREGRALAALALGARFDLEGRAEGSPARVARLLTLRLTGR